MQILASALTGEHLLHFGRRFAEVHTVNALHPGSPELSLAAIGQHLARRKQPQQGC